MAFVQCFFVLLHLCVAVNFITGTQSDVPVGHLKPLGGHRSPDKVDEVQEFPTAEEFMEKYVRLSKPLVFRGAAKQFPAFKIWTESYLQERYPHMEFRMEGKREKEGRMPIGAMGVGRDTLSSFIDTYHTTNRYIVSELPTPMWNDVSILPSLSCGPFVNKFVEIDFWMSGGGTSSKIHKDAYNTINCVLNGTKEWKLVAFEHQDKIYQFKEPQEGVGGFSVVDPDAVDLLKFPLVSKAPWSFTTIEKGDCLYLPGSMWHQVRSFGDMNVAIATLFYRYEDKREVYNYSDCKSGSEARERYVPLTEVDVEWQFPGHGDMTMGVFDFSAAKEGLAGIFNRKGNFSIKRAARDFAGSWGGGTRKQHLEKAKGLLKLFQKWTKKDIVRIEDLHSISRVALREIVPYYHPAMPENSLEYEYFYADELQIKALIKSLISKFGVLRKEEFIKSYQDDVWGTEKFATEIYTRLQGSTEMKDELTEKEVKARLRYAVYKYKHGGADETGFVLAWNETEAFPNQASYAIDEEEWLNLEDAMNGKQEGDEEEEEDNDEEGRRDEL